MIPVKLKVGKKMFFVSFYVKLIVIDDFCNLHSDGQFGAMMQVNIQNDGPVTLDIESPTLKQYLEDQEKKQVEEKKSKISGPSEEQVQ